MIFLTNLPKFVEDFATSFKYGSYKSNNKTKFNRDLSLQRLEKKETMVIYSSERKDKWKNGEIVLAPFGNLSRKLNPGDSLQRVVICRWKRRRVFFCACFTSSLFCIFMISSWAVCSKGLGLVACVCLHFRRYCELQCEVYIETSERIFFFT